MTLRRATRLLTKAGFVETKGKHRRFVHADGRIVTLPRKSRHDVLYGFMAKKVEAYVAGERIKDARHT